jgi:hypothetical protein
MQQTTAIGPPCPPPVVYVVQAQPWGWIVLAGFLFIMWALATIRARRKSPPGIEIHSEPVGPAPLPPLPEKTAPLPEVPEPVAQVYDFGTKRAECESALKNFGYKAPEIKARLQGMDMSQPVEQIIREILSTKPK